MPDLPCMYECACAEPIEERICRADSCAAGEGVGILLWALLAAAGSSERRTVPHGTCIILSEICQGCCGTL